MMGAIGIIASIAILLVIGFIRLSREFGALTERRNFVVTYHNKFDDFVSKHLSSGDVDAEAYHWLTYHSVRIQAEVGAFGGVVNYKPPYQNYIVRDYQLILNTLSLVPDGMAHRSDLIACQNSMVRHTGVMDRRIEEKQQQLRNPLVWLRVGVQSVLLFPVLLLQWMGFIGASFVRSIEGSLLFRVIGILVTLIGLAASLIEIFFSWEQVVDALKGWWG